MKFTPSAEATTLNTRAQVLEEAEKLINGDRADVYGDPASNFGQIADLWTALGFKRDGGKILGEDVALAMVQVKLARLVSAPRHRDSWVDAAGYLALGAEIVKAV